jgi:hypothetical protein
MPPTAFEPATPASERPHTEALDRAVTGLGSHLLYETRNFITTFSKPVLNQILRQFNAALT